MKSKWISALVFLAVGGLAVVSCSDSDESRLTTLPDASSADAGDNNELRTIVIDDVRDSSVNELEPNQNYGLSPWLAVGEVGRERALVEFDRKAVVEALESGELTSASVEFHIGQSSDNWGPDGGTVSLYALSEEWSEWGHRGVAHRYWSGKSYADWLYSHYQRRHEFTRHRRGCQTFGHERNGERAGKVTTIGILRSVKLNVREQGGWLAGRSADIRNLIKYGNCAGPSPDWLFKRNGSWAKVFAKISKTSEAVNRYAGRQ